MSVLVRKEEATGKLAPSFDGQAFPDLKLSPHDALRQAKRTICTGGCGKSRRYYCTECLVPLVPNPQAFPSVSLPVYFHILQSHAEPPQRSTAQHVSVLAPKFATIWRPFPECISAFRECVIEGAEKNTVALLRATLYRFPGDDAKTPAQAVIELPKLKHVVVLDASWTKSTVLISDPLFRELPRLTLPTGTKSRFWRYPPKRGEHSEFFSPDKMESLLSTVEAIHRFCDAYNTARGEPGGTCDNLLWLFAFIHGRVKEAYDQAPQKRQRLMRKSNGMLAEF
ncbi:DTW domain containing protein [Gracilaria domingensis]|nr:DTW domain containing protein [Gracilaria domingensis]